MRVSKRNGKWSYSIELGIDPDTGKRKRITKSGFSNKKEAHIAGFEHEIKIGRK